MAALSELAVKQETFRLGNGTYTVTIGAGGLGSDTSTDDSAYDLAVQAADANCPIATCYIMTATPKGTQTEDSCGVLTTFWNSHAATMLAIGLHQTEIRLLRQIDSETNAC